MVTDNLYPWAVAGETHPLCHDGASICTNGIKSVHKDLVATLTSLEASNDLETWVNMTLELVPRLECVGALKW